MMLLGILISNYKQEVISLNKAGDTFSENEKENRDNMLIRMNEEMDMGNYRVTYVADSVKDIDTYFKVNYVRLDENGKDTAEQFTLYPQVHFSPKMGMSNNPDTRHYWTKDIYSFVTSVPKRDAEKDSFVQHTVGIGDTFFVAKGFVVVRGIDRQPQIPAGMEQPGDKGIGLDLDIYTLTDKQYKAKPILLVRGNSLEPVVSEVEDIGAKFKIDNIDLSSGNTAPDKVKFVLAVSQSKIEKFIIMKAIVFPYINALWIGCLVMVAGFVISIIRRRKEGKRHAEAEV
jgi:cytochrome c-type biogenesis protein CcmF